MLKKLTIKGHPTLPETTIHFQLGLNLLAAENGAGKTSVLEIIAYCLFGTAALRSTLTYFPNLDTSLEFEARQRKLKVVRSKRETILFDGSEPIASGTTAVNAAVLKILGYGLKVFDVTNHIKQGQVDALTDKLRADDRRQVLENTVGLTVLDTVIAELTKASLELQFEVKVLTPLQIVPVLPEMPVGYLEAETRQQLVTHFRNRLVKANTLKAQIEKLNLLVEPVKPEGELLELGTLPALRSELEELTELKQAYTQQVNLEYSLRQELAKLSLVNPPVAPITSASKETLLTMVDVEKQIDRLEQELSLTPKARLSADEISAGFRAHEKKKAVERYLELSKQEVMCPECDAVFHTHHNEELNSLREELNGDTTIVEPIYSLIALQTEAARLTLSLEIADKEHRLRALNKSFIASHRLQLESLQQFEVKQAAYLEVQKQLVALKEKLEAVSVPAFDALYYQQLTNKVKHLETHQVAHINYQAAKAQFDQQVFESLQLQAALSEIHRPAECLQDIETRAEASKDFDYLQGTYETKLAHYNERAQRIDELTANIEDHKKAATGLKEAKRRIKNHLLPSLNTAASSLVTTMTSGKFQRVEMLDDFSVHLDSLPISLRSGSERAVGNIALRVALGQVLTHKVFSVLMGDELDASMGEKRTAELWFALNRLVEQGNVAQVILISHKGCPVDLPHINLLTL